MAGLYRKFLALLALVVLTLSAKTQNTRLTDITGQEWQRVQVDSFVSISVPRNAKKEEIKNVTLYAREDSCVYIVQVAKTDEELKLENFRKSIIDQYIGQGFDLLAEQRISLGQKEGMEFKFLDDISNLEKLKTIHYVRTFSIKNKLYTIVFSVARPYDNAMMARKEAFFTSVQLQNIPPAKEDVTEKTTGSPREQDPDSSFVFYAFAGVLFMLVFVLLVRLRKKKHQ